MGKIELTGEQALANAKANPSRHWFQGEQSPRERLAADSYLPVYHWPKFKLARADPVFTIGSCFAREVEVALIREGVPLVTNGMGVVPQRFESWSEEKQHANGVRPGHVSRGAFNKYTTHSMNIEIQRSIGNLVLPHEGLIEFGPDKWFDPHSSGLEVADEDTALDSRRIITESTRQVLNAKVMFVTLGLTESWIDKSNGRPMNRAPGGGWLTRRKDLFDFADYGFMDVLEQVETMLATVRSEVPGMRFIVTVSPVPHSTFKKQDALVSVSGAKSTLRAVAEHLYRSHDDVDYFPSFEMVMNSPRRLAWEDDQLHVKRDMVAHVISTFMSAYYEA